MGKVDFSQYQGYLVGQIIAAAVGALLLAVDDFAGFFYGGSYVRTWGYIYLGSGILATFFILLGIGGLLLALYSAINSLQAKEDASPMALVENTRRAMLGGAFTAALAAVGAIAFILGNLDADDWWLDSGFYGAFVGGLFTALFAKLMFDKIEV